jgi:hypothetical protein
VLVCSAVREAPDTVAQDSNIEVQQQPHRAALQLQIGDELRRAQGRDCLDGFDFDDDTVRDQQVDAVTAIDEDVPVGDGKGQLRPERDASLRELVFENLNRVRSSGDLQSTCDYGRVFFPSSRPPSLKSAPMGFDSTDGVERSMA